MKQIFDWLREQLIHTANDVSPNTEKLSMLYRAEKLINEAEAKWEKDIVNQLAMMYAVALTKYGVDIREKFDTATQMTMALNEAYIRGRQDEIEKFRVLQSSYEADIRAKAIDEFAEKLIAEIEGCASAPVFRNRIETVAEQLKERE